MKTKLHALTLLIAAGNLFSQTISLNIVNDITGAPIENAEATAIYDNPASPERYDEQIKQTDKDGHVLFRGIAMIGASLRVEKSGYYGFGVTGTEDFRYSSKELDGGVDKTIRLRPILQPTALYGKRTKSEGFRLNQILIPTVSEWCGYDMEIGDWVAPYGEGETADFLLRFERKFVGFDKRFRQKSIDAERAFSKKAFAARNEEWTEEKFRFRAGDWDMSLKIAFPNEKEGLVRVVDQFKPHSILRMPHNAPEEGYSPSYRYEVKTYGKSAWDQRDDVGFFLRTRVVLDENGEIESANYAKIHGDFKVEQDGDLSFSYYFNPKVNERNLEFDPDRNLFPAGTPGTFNFYLP